MSTLDLGVEENMRMQCNAIRFPCRVRSCHWRRRGHKNQEKTWLDQGSDQHSFTTRENLELAMGRALCSSHFRMASSSTSITMQMTRLALLFGKFCNLLSSFILLVDVSARSVSAIEPLQWEVKAPACSWQCVKMRQSDETHSSSIIHSALTSQVAVDWWLLRNLTDAEDLV